jgi:hypothetical protein
MGASGIALISDIWSFSLSAAGCIIAHKCQWGMRTWRRRFSAFGLCVHLIADNWNESRRNNAVVVAVELDIGVLSTYAACGTQREQFLGSTMKL